MPELPEVETIRRDLERELAGRRVTALDVRSARAVRREPAKALAGRVAGAKVVHVHRRGKYLVWRLGTGDWLVVHLRMSGQLLKAGPKDPLPKHTAVVFTFDSGTQVRFVDPRTFGEVYAVHPDHLAEQAPELAEMGFDPVDAPVSWIAFGRMLLARSVQLKAFLMDQKCVAGIGNIYSDEILHAAGLRYDRVSSTLSTQEVRRLYRSMQEVLHEAIKHRGSTLGDEGYVDLHGRPGSYQAEHQVYGRDGQACQRCRAVVTKAKFQGRTTYFCPNCQV